MIDWLAAWFRDDARGSLKALHRLILTSEAYRQSSAPNPEAAEIDPENRLLWRMPRRRLSAEQLRDSMLQVSGELGYFQHSWRAYDREGQPCPKIGCAGTIRRISQSGRSTFFCPAHQR